MSRRMRRSSSIKKIQEGLEKMEPMNQMKNDSSIFEIHLLKNIEDTESGAGVYCLDPCPASSFSDGMARLVAVNWKNQVNMYNMGTGKLEHQEKTRKKPNCVRMMNKKEFMVGDWDGDLYFYKTVPSGKFRKVHFMTSRKKQSHYWNILKLKKNTMIISGGYSCLLSLFEWKGDGSKEFTFHDFEPSLKGNVYDLCRSLLNSDLIYSFGSSGLNEFSIKGRNRVRKIERSGDSKGEGYAVSSYIDRENGEEYLLLGSGDSGNIFIHSARTGELHRQLRGGKHNTGARAFLRYTDRYFIMGDRGSNIFILDVMLDKMILIDGTGTKKSHFGGDAVNKLVWVFEEDEDEDGLYHSQMLKSSKKVGMFACCTSLRKVKVFSFLDKLIRQDFVEEDERERRMFVVDELFSKPDESSVVDEYVTRLELKFLTNEESWFITKSFFV